MYCAHVAAAKTKVRALDLLPLALGAHHFVDDSKSKRRVCGGSSSSERPSTSCARRLAIAISSSVDFDVFERLAAMRDGLPWPLVLVQAARSRG